MKNIFGLLFLLSQAQAATYIECGESVTDDYDVIGFELAISSERIYGYQGPVGGTWNLKLAAGQWLAKNEKITANYMEDVFDTDVEIKIVEGNSPSGPVGTRYMVRHFWANAPVLEKYTMGGFVGSVKVGTYECYSSHD